MCGLSEREKKYREAERSHWRRGLGGVAQSNHAVELRGASGPERPGTVAEEGQQHVRATGVARGGAPRRAILSPLVAALAVERGRPALQVGARGA